MGWTGRSEWRNPAPGSEPTDGQLRPERATWCPDGGVDERELLGSFEDGADAGAPGDDGPRLITGSGVRVGGVLDHGPDQ
jgi:hypothetical protein